MDIFSTGMVHAKPLSSVAGLILALAVFLLVPCLAALSETSEFDMRVMIRSEKKTYRMGETITIQLTLTNVSESGFVIYPGFTDRYLKSHPDTTLTFQVAGPDHRIISRSKDCPRMLYMKEPATPCEFRHMVPGELFGRPIHMNVAPYCYKPDKPGMYKIRAKLTFNAVTWYRDVYPKQGERDRECCRLYPELLLNGEYESNQISITVLEGEAKEEKPPAVQRGKTRITGKSISRPGQ